MIYFLLFCAGIALAYSYGWHHGARWLKNTIERKCNVTIDGTIIITSKEHDYGKHPQD